MKKGTKKIKEEVTATTHEPEMSDATTTPLKVELCNVTFPNEDMNKLVEKLNEVINKLND